MNEEKLLTQDEAGIILRASTRKLQALRERGNGPPFLHIGRNVLYPERALINWLKAALKSRTEAANGA